MKTFAAFAGLLVLAACEGGPGPIVDTPDVERASISNEQPNRSGETPNQVVEEDDDDDVEVPGNGNGNNNTSWTATCAGTYSCVTGGETAMSTLTATANGCAIEDIVLLENGTITRGGQDVGRWTRNGNTVTVVSGNVTSTCTKQ